MGISFLFENKSGGEQSLSENKKDHRLKGDGLALFSRQPGNLFPS
jgi:hypothetical protein